MQIYSQSLSVCVWGGVCVTDSERQSREQSWFIGEEIANHLAVSLTINYRLGSVHFHFPSICSSPLLYLIISSFTLIAWFRMTSEILHFVIARVFFSSYCPSALCPFPLIFQNVDKRKPKTMKSYKLSSVFIAFVPQHFLYISLFFLYVSKDDG